MNIRPAWLLAVLVLALSACGNKGPLMHPSRVAPEDAGRYLVKPKLPPQQDAAQDADRQDSEQDAIDEPAADADAAQEPVVPVDQP